MSNLSICMIAVLPLTCSTANKSPIVQSIYYDSNIYETAIKCQTKKRKRPTFLFQIYVCIYILWFLHQQNIISNR